MRVYVCGSANSLHSATFTHHRCATYVGGSANFFGVAAATHAAARHPGLLPSLLAADLALMGVYLLLLTARPPSLSATANCLSPHACIAPSACTIITTGSSASRGHIALVGRLGEPQRLIFGDSNTSVPRFIPAACDAAPAWFLSWPVAIEEHTPGMMEQWCGCGTTWGGQCFAASGAMSRREIIISSGREVIF